jgi:CRP-like cAMP-binding protein
MFTNFYLIETGIIKFYRDVRFTTVQNGAIAFNAPYKDKDKDKDKYFTRPLKIEIDELGPGRFFAEYELFNYKQSQYTAITHMPCSVFLIS